MEQKGELISFRPDIKVVDCTIRDGGLVNNFGFTDDFVRQLYKTNVEAGVDYMEFGYKASKAQFPVNDFGKWKFCDEKDIRDIVGENNTDMKISVMADVGRTDFRKDIIPKKDSVIDMIRIATYVSTIPAAVEMINYCHDLGYETTINIMAVSTAKEEDLKLALDILSKSPVDVIYLVDSYGSLYPEEIRRMSDYYLGVAEANGKKVGIHAHNNQMLAFANTIEACSIGVSYLDATMAGMGRGAGNCFMELLLGFLRNPKYNIRPVFKFIETHMNKLKEEGNVWGCDVQYMITGQRNQHPRTAIAFTADKRTDYLNFFQNIIED
jgi:4-hydroxy 2-oxovalerate aldolase